MAIRLGSLAYMAMNFKETVSETRWKVRSNILGYPLTWVPCHMCAHPQRSTHTRAYNSLTYVYTQRQFPDALPTHFTLWAIISQAPRNFLKLTYLFIYVFYVFESLFASMPAWQKRASDLIIDGCELPCDCWELKSGPLEKKPVFITTGPSLQPSRNSS